MSPFTQLNYVIISTSLSPNSRSRVLANFILEDMKEHVTNVDLIDMREFELPHCDADKAYSDPVGLKLKEKIKAAHGIILCSPIYNFDTNAVSKNLIELTGKAWSNKVVGFACAAGGHGSYMSIMSMASSLMLDFRCVVIPRFVYAQDGAFKGNKIVDSAIQNRLLELSLNLRQFSQGLMPYLGLIDLKN